MRKFFKASLIAAALCGAVGAYAATQDTANLSVSLTITSACSISTLAPTVAFGSHAQTDVTPVNNVGTITVTCASPTQSYSLLLGPGAHNVGGRRMQSGTNYVPYELYSDNGYTQVWGDTIGTDTQTGTGTDTFTVYGQVPSLSFPAGNYTDTVLVTVDF